MCDHRENFASWNFSLALEAMSIHDSFVALRNHPSLAALAKIEFCATFSFQRLCRFLGLVEPIFWRSFLFPVCLFAASSYLECSGCLALRVVDKTLTQDKGGGTTGQAFLTSTALQFPASSFPYTYYYTESDAYHTVMIAIIIGNFHVVIEYERRWRQTFAAATCCVFLSFSFFFIITTKNNFYYSNKNFTF